MNKTTFCILLFMLISFFFGCSHPEIIKAGFEEYRFNPFQFPYSEYYLKAKVIPLEDRALSDHAFPINAFDRRFKVSNIFADKVVLKNQVYQVKKEGKLQFIILKDEEKMMGCNSVVRNIEKDFCSAFSSSREYYEKLFTLTPDELKKEINLPVGNRWIVHHKGHLFQDVEKISIYKRKGLVAFRTDFKSNSRFKTRTDLKIFLDSVTKSYITIGLINPDEKLIHQILTTIW